MKTGAFSALLLCGLCMTACSHLPLALRGSPQPQTTIDASALLAALYNRNSTLTRFKGIGHATFETKNSHTQYARMAWLGSEPDRMRIEILAPTGQPVMSLAADGQFFYMKARNDQSVYKMAASQLDLEDFISIPIRFNEIFKLLKGSLPENPGCDVTLTKGPTGNETTLTLDAGWFGQELKIYLDESGTNFYKLERFDTFGNLAYRAVFLDNLVVDGYTVPQTIQLTASTGAGFTLRVDRFWVDTPIEPSAFTLLPPVSDKTNGSNERGTDYHEPTQ
jgi:outer membrane biogenesis lipoprotein LolB